MLRTRTTYRFTRSGLASVLVLFVLIGGAAYTFGTQHSRIDIVGLRTVTATTTQVISDTTTTVTSTTTTSIETSTVTYIGPGSVNLSGSVRSLGIGTQPVSLTFTDLRTKATTVCPVTNGVYHCSLGNSAYYSTKLSFTTVTGGVGSGSCESLALVLFSLQDSLGVDWSC